MRPSSSRSEPEASSSPYGGLLGGLPGDPPVDAVVGDRSLVSAMLRAEAALAAAQATVGLAPATAARGHRPGRRLPRLRRRRAGRRGSRVGQPGRAAGGLADPGRRRAGRGRRPLRAPRRHQPGHPGHRPDARGRRGGHPHPAPPGLLRLEPRAPRDWARVNAHGRPHAGPARGAHDVRAHGDRVAHRHRRGHGAAAREPVAARRPARRPGRDRCGVEPAAARAAGGLRGRDGAAGRHPVAHGPEPGRRAGGGARAGRDRVREDRHRCGGVVPERDRRAARGGGARPRRVLGHAAQAEPGGSRC